MTSEPPDPTLPSQPPPPSFLYSNVDNLLHNKTNRVKYSSLAVSTQFIVFGANTGSIYFHERESLRFLSLVSFPDAKDPITHLSFDPTGTLLAFTTSKGLLYAIELNVNSIATSSSGS